MPSGLSGTVVERVIGEVGHDRTPSPRQRQRRSQRRSLQPEQLGQFTAWTPLSSHRGWATGSFWEDGVEELASTHAVVWTKRAVRVRFGAPSHRDEVGVWAGAVERAW